MDILTLADVKQYLGIKDGVDVELLTSIVAAANSVVLSYLGEDDLGVTTYTERYNGTGSASLVPDHGPITTVDTLSIDGRPLKAVDLAQRPWNGFDFDKDVVVLHGGEKFIKGLRNVQITYQAGYTSVPAQVKQAAVYIASQMYKRKDRIGVSSKSIGPETISYTTNDLDASAKMLLNDYRKRWLTS